MSGRGQFGRFETSFSTLNVESLGLFVLVFVLMVFVVLVFALLVSLYWFLF